MALTAQAKVFCRWRFSEPAADVDDLQYFHSLDLVVNIVPTLSKDTQGGEDGDGECCIPVAKSTVLETFVHKCCAIRPSSKEFEVAAKVVIVPHEGFLCRTDILELRMRDSDFVDSVIQFSSLDGHFPSIGNQDQKSLLQLLSSSPGALVAKQSPIRHHEALALLESELKTRLSFEWVLPTQPATRTIAMIGGRPKYDMNKQLSFGDQGVFAAARALGISLIVLDRPGLWLDGEAHSYLGHSFIAIEDMTDEAKLTSRIIEALKGTKIDGIVTFLDDYIITTAKAAEILRLPAEPVLAFQQALHKHEARKLLTPSTQALRIDSAEQLDTLSMAETLKDLEYPLVVKPCRGGGSRGVKKVNSYSEMRQAIQKLEETGLSKYGFLLEPYIDGPEVDANFILWDGEILFFEISDDFPSQADAADARPSDNFSETIIFLPSRLDAEEVQLIRSTLHQSLLKLGFRSGVFHLEARIQNSSMQYRESNGILDLGRKQFGTRGQAYVFLIEVNARPPGLQAVAGIDYTYGVDYGALQLLRALGDRERFAALSKPFTFHAQYECAILFIPVHRENIRVPQDFCAQVIQRLPEIAPHVSRAECTAFKRVVSPVGGTGFIGYFLIRSRTSRSHVLEMSRRVEDISKQVLDGF